jgi:hypothetical protein
MIFRMGYDDFLKLVNGYPQSNNDKDQKQSLLIIRFIKICVPSAIPL